MPRGGYSESTERWSAEESLQLLDLISEHKHKWTLIQQQMPNRTIHQIRCKWLRMRRTLRDYNADTTQKRQLCKHCGEKLVAHICTKKLNEDDLQRAKRLDDFRIQHCTFKSAPVHQKIKKAKKGKKVKKAKKSKNGNSDTKWKPTPPNPEADTAKDFDMIVSYINSVNTSDVLPTTATLTRCRNSIRRRRGAKATRIRNNRR